MRARPPTVTTAERILAEHDARRDKALGLLRDDDDLEARIYLAVLGVFVAGLVIGFAAGFYWNPPSSEPTVHFCADLGKCVKVTPAESAILSEGFRSRTRWLLK